MMIVILFGNQYVNACVHTLMQIRRFRLVRQFYIKLVLRSTKPNTEQFTDWVCSEALPSIRQSRSYMSDASFLKKKGEPVLHKNAEHVYRANYDFVIFSAGLTEHQKEPVYAIQ